MREPEVMMVRRWRSYVRVAFVLVPLAACAPADPAPDPADLGEAVRSVGAAIKGGYLDEADTSVVGVVRLSGGMAACSGTLIAPNVVLTAQHCVASIGSDGSVICGVTKFGTAYGASTLYVTTLTSFSMDPADYHPASEVVIVPGGTDVCGNDMAIIVLAHPIDAAEAGPRMPRVDSAIAKGDEYSAIGYGQLGSSGQSGTRYRRDGLFAKCVGEACSQSQIADTEWRGDTGVCSGDSGGPALDLQDRVVGVASRGADGCELPVYSHVFGWGEWIKETVAAATAAAGIETPAWANGYPTDPVYWEPVGADCDAPEQCSSNICIDGKCSRVCSEAAPCPEGYECAEYLACHPLAEPAAPKKKTTTLIESGCSAAGPPTSSRTPGYWLLGLAGLASLCRRRGRGGAAARPPGRGGV